MEKTDILAPDLVDTEELKRLEKEAIDRILNKQIDAENTKEFLNKLGEKQLIRQRSAPETLKSDISIPESSVNKYTKRLPDAPDSSIMSSVYDAADEKTLHPSRNMVSQEALDYIKNLKGKTRADLPEVPSFLKNPIAKRIAKAGASTGIGASISGPIGAVAGLAGSLMQEELGPETGSDDEIIENPKYPLEIRKQALMRAKNKYLKPQE